MSWDVVMNSGYEWLISSTSSTAQGGGGSFKNGKPIGEVSWCDAKMAERTHWWIERWLSVSPFLSLFLSFSLCLSFAIYLQSYLSSHLPIYSRGPKSEQFSWMWTNRLRKSRHDRVTAGSQQSIKTQGGCLHLKDTKYHYNKHERAHPSHCKLLFCQHCFALQTIILPQWFDLRRSKTEWTKEPMKREEVTVCEKEREEDKKRNKQRTQMKKPREPWSYKFVGHELKPRLFPPAWWIPWVFPKNPGFFKEHFPEGPEKPLCWNCAIPYQKTVTGALKRSRLWKPHLMEQSIKEIISLYSLWMPLDMCPMDGRDPILYISCESSGILFTNEFRKHSYGWDDYPMQKYNFICVANQLSRLL